MNKIKLFWNKFWSIFDIMSNKKRNIVKSTKSGRLFIETTDFLKQKKVKRTIEFLLDSDLIKEIDEKNRNRKIKENKVHA